MVATDSVRPRTGNVSADTSAFAMIVLEAPLRSLIEEIDLVATPSGAPVAMAHANNCTSDLNAWVEVFSQFAEAIGAPVERGRLFDVLLGAAAKGDMDKAGVTYFLEYFSLLPPLFATVFLFFPLLNLIPCALC